MSVSGAAFHAVNNAMHLEHPADCGCKELLDLNRAFDSECSDLANQFFSYWVPVVEKRGLLGKAAVHRAVNLLPKQKQSGKKIIFLAPAAETRAKLAAAIAELKVFLDQRLESAESLTDIAAGFVEVEVGRHDFALNWKRLKAKVACPHCRGYFDYGRQPEVSMGAVKCPRCGKTVPQGKFNTKSNELCRRWLAKQGRTNVTPAQLAAEVDTLISHTRGWR
jgi:hypothetical protein